ncbi:hypothetical protein JOB18_007681 [Solea senegalensis]|uniref:Uncharacterized protein n=1 Tax=Solea senegalensis TaxID=28829 RepID=A0AAV6RMB1_SOLSE|nr:hypothetical protein JOB18_007681 [Solea senegalensis]
MLKLDDDSSLTRVLLLRMMVETGSSCSNGNWWGITGGSCHPDGHRRDTREAEVAACWSGLWSAQEEEEEEEEEEPAVNFHDPESNLAAGKRTFTLSPSTRSECFHPADHRCPGGFCSAQKN